RSKSASLSARLWHASRCRVKTAGAEVPPTAFPAAPRHDAQWAEASAMLVWITMILGTAPHCEQAPGRSSQRMLLLAAALTVGLHTIGLALAVFGMREGTPLVGLAERIAHLAEAPLSWSIGWAVWMLCALSLV